MFTCAMLLDLLEDLVHRADPGGADLAFRWALYSSSKSGRLLLNATRGELAEAALGGERHRVAESSSSLRSPSLPAPAVHQLNVSSMRLVPSRHGTHCPQDS